jgi:hypothetical protein
MAQRRRIKRKHVTLEARLGFTHFLEPILSFMSEVVNEYPNYVWDQNKRNKGDRRKSSPSEEEKHELNFPERYGEYSSQDLKNMRAALSWIRSNSDDRSGDPNPMGERS